MPFSIRPYRCFPVECAVTYKTEPFLKLPLVYFLSFASLITLLVLSRGPAYAVPSAFLSTATHTPYAGPLLSTRRVMSDAKLKK